ncbi:unnamed protein product [Durusdinium trenchii]|uniref:Protein Abitram n=1 Tax=Durusdinium trenchii TaxID=1381693 RepID=A0ABP0S639_9DINO
MASIADSTLGSVLSRGFETYAAGDVCIKKHPNGLFVVTLAPSHPLAQRDAPVVTEVRFGADLCENEAYGKRCRGGANVNTKTLLAEVVSEAGSYTIRSPIEARLVELNSLLSEEPQLLQQSPEDEGFLAILQPKRPQDARRILEKLLLQGDGSDPSLSGGGPSWAPEKRVKKEHGRKTLKLSFFAA